jgi:predicted alpha-1,2-mannosidase
MKTYQTILFLSSILSFAQIGSPAICAEGLTRYVNPWMGVIGRGNAAIGPQWPWGSINPGPDTKNGFTDGYDPTQKIRGFSQLHVTGTGGRGKYGQFLISPQVGLNVTETGHDSAKGEEEAKASSYRVRLIDYHILCELTPTKHAAIYRFTFPKSSEAHLVVDLGHNIPQDCTPYRSGYADQGEVFLDPQTRTIRGWGHYWGGTSSEPFSVYFAARYSKPAVAFGTWKDGLIARGVARQKVYRKRERIGAYLRYDTRENEEVFLKIAVSFSGMDQALSYLDHEIPAWDFERTRAAAEAAWNEKLKKIIIEGAPEDQKTIFYTALYNTMRMPRDRSGDNPSWKSDQPYWDDHYCIWDTWRTLFPLHVLINESMVRDNVKAFLDRFRHNGQVLDAFIAGNDGYYEWVSDENPDWFRNQGGDDVDNVIADAYLKNVRGIDWKAAYDLLRNNAERERAPSYRIGDRGWVPYRKYEFGFYCSRSLEFSYNDFCVAEVARGLGYTQDAERYLRRSRGWENLWNPQAESDGFQGFLAPRWLDGAWVPYDPKSDRAVASPGGPDRSFYEGTSWVYSYFVPHDFARLIALSGGPRAYCEKLTHALEKNLIDFSNEPSFLTPLSFIYASRPDLASYWVRKNVNRYTKDGFPGDEDSGAMSSWFIFATLGFFPNAGQDVYLIIGPMYPKATLTMLSGKQIIIEGIGASPENIYVQSAFLNGKPLHRAWLRHEDLQNGAVLKFVMGPKPSTWGQTPVPPSSPPIRDPEKAKEGLPEM